MVSATFDQGRSDVRVGPDASKHFGTRCALSVLSVGMNCALGPDSCGRTWRLCKKWRRTRSVAIPTPALPNEMGQYDLGPAEMAKLVGEFADNGWVNIVGRLLRHRPEHIAAMASA